MKKIFLSLLFLFSLLSSINAFAIESKHTNRYANTKKEFLAHKNILNQHNYNLFYIDLYEIVEEDINEKENKSTALKSPSAEKTFSDLYKLHFCCFKTPQQKNYLSFKQIPVFLLLSIIRV